MVAVTIGCSRLGQAGHQVFGDDNSSKSDALVSQCQEHFGIPDAFEHMYVNSAAPGLQPSNTFSGRNIAKFQLLSIVSRGCQSPSRPRKYGMLQSFQCCTIICVLTHHQALNLNSLITLCMCIVVHCCQVQKSTSKGLPVKTLTGEVVYQPNRQQQQQQQQASKIQVAGVTVQDTRQLEQQMQKAETAAAAAAAEEAQRQAAKQQQQQQRAAAAMAVDQGKGAWYQRRVCALEEVWYQCVYSHLMQQSTYQSRTVIHTYMGLM